MIRYYFSIIKERISQCRKETIISVIFLFLAFSNTLFLAPPSKFPSKSFYKLEYGETLSSVSRNFKENKIIRSQFFFKSFVCIFSFGKPKVLEGDYALSKGQPVWLIAWRVSHGKFDISPVKITIPEGMNSFEIAEIFARKFPFFNKSVFVENAQKYEGYLFPDTYFFLPNVKETDVIKSMTDNFAKRIAQIDEEIKEFGKPLPDVIKMASIIEEEARTTEVRKIIAGILWKRIELGMPLQVDSSFKYINGKTTKDLTTEDLKIDSPYNSYTHLGLPPTPISNPGLEAILAAIEPEKTPYLYFLTDNEGNMHYAKTHDEHVENKAKYLK